MKHIESKIVYNDQSGPGEVEFDVSGKLSREDPGRFYGPIEDCYPPEPSELLSWSVTQDGKENKSTQDFEDKISTNAALYNDIEQLLIEAQD